MLAPRTVVVAVIATASVLCTKIAVDGWKSVRSPDAVRSINVTAQATHHVTPDHLTWGITFHAKGDDRDAAAQSLHEAVSAAHDYLVAHGIAEAELSLKPVNVESLTTDETSSGETTTTTLGSLEVTQQLVITSSDVERALRAHHEAELADEMVGADLEEPTCTVSGIELVEKLLVTEARHDARAKAEAMAEDYGGAKLGKLVTGDVGAFDAHTTGLDGCRGAEATATATASYEIE